MRIDEEDFLSLIPARPTISFTDLEGSYTIYGERRTLYNSSVWEMTVAKPLPEPQCGYAAGTWRCLLVSPDMNENLKLIEALQNLHVRTWQVVKNALSFVIPEGMTNVAVRWDPYSDSAYLVVM